MKFAGFAALGLSLLISACSTIPPLGPPVDPSQPNIASIYYNLTASYLHYQGDFPSADQLYNLSLSQDPASPQIRKQILINSCYMYLNDLISVEQITGILHSTKAVMSFDEEMLQAAHSVYAALRDHEGVAWSLDEQLARFPSARAYLQKFMYQYLEQNTKDEALLKKALKLSGEDVEAMLMTAQMYETLDAGQAIAIVRKLLKDFDYPPAADYLVRLYIQTQDHAGLKSLFAQYSYPRDAERQKTFLIQLNSSGLYVLTAEFQDALINTEYSDLVVELAYAGLMSDNLQLMLRIGDFLTRKIPEPTPDGLIASLLLTYALFEPTFLDPGQYVQALDSTAQALDIMQYYTLKIALETSLTTSIRDDEHYAGFAELVSERFGNSLLADYLIYQASHQDADSTLVAPETYALANSLINAGRGDEQDFALVLHYLYTAGDTPQRIDVLRRALQRYPDNSLYLNDLGYTLLENPEAWNEAEALISQALDQEPDNAFYQDSMLWLKYLQGNYNVALQYADLLSLQSELPGEIYYHLGMLYSALLDPAKAIQFLKKAGADTSSPDYQNKAATALENLER